MENQGFFKFLWRMNAVLVTCILIGIIGKFLYYDIYQRFISRPELPPYVTANVETYRLDETGEKVVENRWRYTGMDRVPGTATLLFHLYALPVTDDQSQHVSTRNFLFVDQDLEATAWLFPSNQQQILSHDWLAIGDPQRTLAILYQVEDLNPDESVGEAGQSIFLSRPDGGNLTQVVADMDRQMGYELTDDNQLALFYVKNGQIHAVRVALSDFSVVKSMALPAIIDAREISE